MNFLRHPLYSAFGLGMCAWLSVCNARGIGLMQPFIPASWLSSGSGGTGGHSSGVHGFGGVGHK